MELIKQQDNDDCGVANCVMIINHYSKAKITIEEFKLTHNYQRNEYSLDDIKNVLSTYSIEIEYYEIESLNNIIEANTYPVLLLVKNKDGLNHYVSISRFENELFEVCDPNYKVKRKLSVKQLRENSLNVVGFIRKVDKKKDNKKVVDFNKKYFYRLWTLFKEQWIMFTLINLLGVINLFTFFFSNMFVKVLLSEYAYLTIKRAILIVSIFVGLVTVWLLITLIMRQLCKYNDKKVGHSYLSYLDSHYDLNKVNKSFNREQQLQEAFNLLSVVKQQLFLLNNFLSFITFTSLVIYLTSHISIVLLVGTLILMLTLFVLKIIQAKRTIVNNQISKLTNNKTNYFINSLVDNFQGIKQRTDLKNYLKINEIFLTQQSIKDNSWIVYFEKLSIYLYYFLMIYCLYTTSLDISLFLVITNITFVFSHQLENILTNLNGSFLTNRQLKIINNLKPSLIVKKEPKNLISVKKTIVKNNVVRVKKSKDVLIGYKTINEWKDNDQVFDTSVELVTNETIANNLFNFGNNNGIDKFSEFNLVYWLDKLNIDLTIKASYLNDEQKEFIKIVSCLFTKRKIILIKKNTYNWFLLIERDLKKHLSDKMVIIYE